MALNSNGSGLALVDTRSWCAQQTNYHSRMGPIGVVCMTETNRDAKCITPPPVPGVYMYRNTGDGRMYIGMSRNLLKRHKQHLSLLKNNAHSNWEFQQAWNQEGAAFDYFVLEYVSAAIPIEKADDLLNERESFFQNMVAKHLYNPPEVRRAYGLGQGHALVLPQVWEDAGKDTVTLRPFQPLFMPQRVPAQGVLSRSRYRVQVANAQLMIARRRDIHGAIIAPTLPSCDTKSGQVE